MIWLDSSLVDKEKQGNLMDPSHTFLHLLQQQLGNYQKCSCQTYRWEITQEWSPKADLSLFFSWRFTSTGSYPNVHTDISCITRKIKSQNIINCDPANCSSKIAVQAHKWALTNGLTSQHPLLFSFSHYYALYDSKSLPFFPQICAPSLLLTLNALLHFTP